MLNSIFFILCLSIHQLFPMENDQVVQKGFEPNQNKRVPSLALLSTQAWLDYILALKIYKSPKKFSKKIKNELKKNQLPYGTRNFLYANAVPDYFKSTQHGNKTNLKAINLAHTLAVYNEDYYTWPYGEKLKKLGAETAAFCPCQSLLVYNQRRSKTFNFLDLTVGELTNYALNLKEHILPTTAIEHCICHESNQLKVILINPSNTPLIYIWHIPEEIETAFSTIDLQHGVIQAMQAHEDSLYYSRAYNSTDPAIYEFTFGSANKIKRTSKHGIINSLTIDRQKHVVIAGSRDHNLYLFDFRMAKLIAQITHPEKVTATASHEPFFASGTSVPDGKVFLYDYRKINNSGCTPLEAYSFETSHPSPFMLVQYGPTAQPSISLLSFKGDASSLVIQNEAYHTPESDIFEQFISPQKSVNLKNLKSIIDSYALKMNKHPENSNEN